MNERRVLLERMKVEGITDELVDAYMELSPRDGVECFGDGYGDTCRTCGEPLTDGAISNTTLAMFDLFFCSEECADTYILSK